jgi:ABC-type bacteriocin/lantibiotic exporter with double-glycine peptidase domain
MASTMRVISQITRSITLYVAFAAKNFRSFYVVIILTALVLLMEYLATSLMIPLAPGQAASNSVITRTWIDIAERFGLEPVSRTWLWLFFIVMMIRLVLGYTLSVLTTWLGKRLHETISGKVFGHILQVEPMGHVYTRSVGHYITMAGDDTFKSGTIVSSLMQAAVGMFTALVGMVVLLQFSKAIFVSIVLFLLLTMAVVVILLRMVLRVNNAAVTLSRELGTTFVEALNSLRSIRSLHAERFVMDTYAAQIHSYVRMLVELDAIKTGVKAFPAISLLFVAAIALRPGADVTITDATLFAGTVIVIRIFASLGQMATAGSQLLTDIRAVKDIDSLIQLAQERQQSAPESRSIRVRSIDLKGVSFSYGGRGSVLTNLTFHFKAGKTYAVIGPTGSGKSTLADILLGLSLPDSGELVINDGAILSTDGRPRIMLVEQQPKIFSTTIRENLLMGANVSDDELYKALNIVNLDELIQSLDKGLDTRLSYLGENFSGGQRQRLGIARALIRKPDLLLLDEATSALDPETRANVVDKLRETMREGIIIFITHDTDIARLADQVLQIQKANL